MRTAHAQPQQPSKIGSTEMRGAVQPSQLGSTNSGSFGLARRLPWRMAADTSDVDHLLELLAPLGATNARRMFGGWGLYVDGLIVAIVIDGELLLKVDEASRDAFEAAGCRPFLYRAKGREVPMSYWSVPESALDSPEAMRPWARKALDAALRKPAAKPKRAGKRAR